MSRLKPLVCIAFISALSAIPAQASNRLAHRFGFHAGFIGDPFPTLVGLNANYNLFDFMRLTAGYGTISTTVSSIDPNTLLPANAELSATTIGGGVRLLNPSWSFSPMVGISYATVTVTTTGSIGTEKVGGFSANGSHFYGGVGFDWQTGGGFNLGFGYNFSFLSGVGGLPFFNLGWYF